MTRLRVGRVPVAKRPVTRVSVGRRRRAEGVGVDSPATISRCGSKMTAATAAASARSLTRIAGTVGPAPWPVLDAADARSRPRDGGRSTPCSGTTAGPATTSRRLARPDRVRTGTDESLRRAVCAHARRHGASSSDVGGSGPGRFARQVAAGAVTAAEGSGPRGDRERADEARLFDDAPADWNLFSVGTFEDDVVIVNEARSAARGPRHAAARSPPACVTSRPWSSARRHLRHRAMVPRAAANVAAVGPRRVTSSRPSSKSPAPGRTIPPLQAVAGAVIAVRCARLAEGGAHATRALGGCRRDLHTSTLLRSRSRSSASRGCRRSRRRCCVRWRAAGLQLIAYGRRGPVHRQRARRAAASLDLELQVPYARTDLVVQVRPGRSRCVFRLIRRG